MPEYPLGDAGTYQALQETERRGLMQRYSNLRNQLQVGMNQRGIGRSGFAGEAMTGLANEQQGALAEIQSGLTDRLMRYRQEQERMDLLKKMSKREKKKGKRSWLGPALAAGGAVLGGVFGGAPGAMAGGAIGGVAGGALAG